MERCAQAIHFQRLRSIRQGPAVPDPIPARSLRHIGLGIALWDLSKKVRVIGAGKRPGHIGRTLMLDTNKRVARSSDMTCRDILHCFLDDGLRAWLRLVDRLPVSHSHKGGIFGGIGSVGDQRIGRWVP